MLVLSRKTSQQVMIGSDVSITIVRIDRNQVRLGINKMAQLPGNVIGIGRGPNEQVGI